MDVNSYSMSDVLSRYVSTYQLPEELADIIGGLASDGISAENIQELRGRIQILLDPAYKGQVLDLILYYT